MITRRKFLTGTAVAAGGAALLKNTLHGQVAPPPSHPSAGSAAIDRKLGYRPVITPGGVSAPWKIVDGTKVFHLIAEPVRHEMAPGLLIDAWGYNGRVHGPTIEAVEGDRVRIYVTNKLPAGTSVHWHGILLPNGMDGVAGLTQRSIKPNETFKYEFTLRQHGTHMYHSHHDEMTQMALGTMGLFIIHPRNPQGPQPDRDFGFMLSEWRIDPGTSRPNPNEMTDFNMFTLNGKAFPGTVPMIAKLNERVRIRVANVSAMDHHPIHLHGFQFRVTETDGGQIPESAQQRETTVLVPIGTSRTIDFVADALGDWPMHCHMTHHVMNQMGHEFPNMIGVNPGDLDKRVRSLLPDYMTMGQNGMGEHGLHIESGHMKVPRNSIPMVGGRGPFDYITMGGMFTVLKVREGITNYDDPGWYQHPPGTVANLASADDLRRDDIDVQAAPSAPPTQTHHHPG